MAEPIILGDFPFWVKQSDPQPDYFFTHLERLWMFFGDAGFQRHEVRFEIPALGLIAIWNGQVHNGGVEQFFLNRFFDLIDSPEELAQTALFSLKIFDDLRSSAHKRLYLDTLNLFIDQGSAMLEEAADYNIVRLYGGQELDDRICAAARSLEEDLFVLFTRLERVTYVSIESFSVFLQTYAHRLASRRESMRADADSFIRKYLSTSRMRPELLAQDRQVVLTQRNFNAAIKLIKSGLLEQSSGKGSV